MRIFSEATSRLKGLDTRDHEGIGGVVKNSKNEILMLKHKKFGFWTIPVGKVEPGDSLEKTVDKELKEETGVLVDKKELVSMETRKYDRDGSIVKVKNYLYIIHNYSGEIENKEQEKHEELRWVKLKDVRSMENISHATKDMLRHFDIMDTIL